MKKIKLFDALYVSLGVILLMMFSLTFEGNLVMGLWTILFVSGFFLITRKKNIGYLFISIGTIFYLFIAKQAAFYGEIFSAMLIILPMSIYGLIKFYKKEKMIEENSISKKSLIILAIILIGLFIGFYFLLFLLNSEQVILNSISIIFAIILAFLIGKKSYYKIYVHIFYDAFLIFLWLTPLFYHDSEMLSVVVCPLLILINNIYWLISFKKKEA